MELKLVNAATGLDNSTLLGPLEPDDFAMVNRARWDQRLPTVLLQRPCGRASGPSSWRTCWSTAPAPCRSC